MRKGEAFDTIGCPLPNVRWGWSGVSNDNSKVAILIWDGEFPSDSPIGASWDIRSHEGFLRLTATLGNRQRLAHIRHAIDELNGVVELVWAEDAGEKSRGGRVKKAWLTPHLVGRISDDEFDEETGGFRLVLAKRNSNS